MKKVIALLVLSCCFVLVSSAFTTIYNGTTYSSTQPYNLDIYYFKAADVPLDAAYRQRISGMMLWLQDYYKQWMITNGYGARTFGLWTEQAQPDTVRIIMINGAHNLSFYQNSISNPGGNDSLINEVADFRAANAALVTSAHSLVLTAAPDLASMHDLPYYGIGRDCYATDYPQLDLQYLGQGGSFGTNFVTYFGGMAHELGHGLNLPHSHQTATENASPAHGESLMAAGNYSLTASPTFINRAGSAILSNCQLFSAVTNTNLYNGHITGITALHASVVGSDLIVSGRFQSNRPVTDINFYQDPGASPTAGYVRVAFSTPPLGALQDSFWVSMPASEVLQDAGTYPPTGPYNLEIELVLANGETSEEIFPFQYSNSLPVAPPGFNDNLCDPVPGNWQLADIGAMPVFPGQACWNAANESLTLKSWGGGLGGSADAATFLYVPVSSDDTIVARVTSVSATWNYLAGLMVRSDLNAASNFVVISALDTRGVFSTWRTNTGDPSSYNVVTTQALPMWLRLARTGNTINTWYSADGSSWTLYDTHTQNFGSTAYMGLVSSGTGAKGVFDSVRVSNGLLSIGGPARGVSAGLATYPNPATDVLNVGFDAVKSGIADMTLTDGTGRIVLHEVHNCGAGPNSISVDTRDVATGLYLLHVQCGDELMQIAKVVIGK
jgi:regulation of enolase protein 1 (concanavalin A-like superfamily)